MQQTNYLNLKYHVVVANPPYMGGKGMNGRLGAWAKENYRNSKSDLFAMFIERGLELVPKYGYSAMVTMQSWMFLSSFQKMRERMLQEKTLRTMAHLGARAFGSISGEVVQTTSFVLTNIALQQYKPAFFRLLEGDEGEKRATLERRNTFP